MLFAIIMVIVVSVSALFNDRSLRFNNVFFVREDQISILLRDDNRDYDFSIQGVTRTIL